MNNVDQSRNQNNKDISQIIIGGIEEIIGWDDHRVILNSLQVPYEINPINHTYLKRPITQNELGKIETILVEKYGEAGCRGAALHFGRTFFSGFFREYGDAVH